MLQLLDEVDTVRKEVGRRISQERKSELGQFLTPATVARFMASLFTPSALQTARLLDPGAGIGSLSGAFLDRLEAGSLVFSHVQVVAYEIDANLRSHLSHTLEGYRHRLDLEFSVLPGDFIEEAVKLLLHRAQRFTHAILNPPYKKMNSASRHRGLLRRVGIESVNLYSAFVALTVDLIQPGGQLVAIIPRSFCNGPYYRPFRELVLGKTAIKRMHLFGARNRAFKDDDVLQENVIILLERAARQGKVTVSTSTDDAFTDMEINTFPFDRIVFPRDAERFIHVPTFPEHSQLELSPVVHCSLHDIGLEVSTGPVVDFRLRTHIRAMPEPTAVPLLYPCHFQGETIEWPMLSAKKPNAILRNEETEKWLYPNGCYVVVRRFSSKEEKRRVMAYVVYPAVFDSPMLGFENHLNVLHCEKRGIQEDLARGLCLFLNSTALDEQFRRFSGHTQVNATDLRLLKYPDRETLGRLGVWAKAHDHLNQQRVDRKIESLLCRKAET
jgi:adenine-specific DNA-methyltransferase